MKSIAALLVLSVALMCVAPALADEAISDEDRAAAQVLFDEGRTLTEADDWEAACEKFQESMRLHPATGTQLNLARCYEQIDKLASAWINWVEAKERAIAAGRPDRSELAAERAEALADRISFITVMVEYPLDGMLVRRDGTEVGAAQWDTKLPIDRGTHRFEVTAPGRKSWHKNVKIEEEGAHVTVRVPPLERVAVTPDPEPPPPEDVAPEPDATAESDGVSGQLVAGAVFTALGGVGLALGIGFGVAAMSSDDESKTHCPQSPDLCTREGVDLRVEAFTFSYVSTAGFVAAGAGLLTGIILMATAPSDRPPRMGLSIVPVPHGMGVGGRF